MNTNRYILAVLTAAAGLLAGCDAGGAHAERWQVRARFADDAGALRVTVYGDLYEQLPHYEAAPALEYFLYGPSDFGQAVLRNPQGLTVAGDRLIVADQGYPGVLGIELKTGRKLFRHDPDHPPQCPVDVAVDDADNIYVADTSFHAVLVYDAEGDYVGQLVPDGERAFRPVSLLIADGLLYVGDAGGRCVQLFDLGQRLWLAPLNTSLDQQGIIAPTGLAMDEAGTLLVGDGLQGCVFRLAKDGQWLPPIGRRGRLAGQFIRPKQLAVAQGYVFVADAGRQSLQVFDRQGEYITEIYGASEWAGWTLPTRVTVLPNEVITSMAGEDDALPVHDLWLLVSDTMGPVSLTVLGVDVPSGQGGQP